ncbi:uncharacterized protein LOC127733394 [Mytilus californianus]|uniref:uncharacterized protein LOC127733394 n=1 Tax=Mytilus californianus TaxID=6549 RepID=UPI0022451B24|nr:uncharacterized protein LOC127733394 [Mytilus californianus]
MVTTAVNYRFMKLSTAVVVSNCCQLKQSERCSFLQDISCNLTFTFCSSQIVYNLNILWFHEGDLIHPNEGFTTTPANFVVPVTSECIQHVNTVLVFPVSFLPSDYGNYTAKVTGRAGEVTQCSTTVCEGCRIRQQLCQKKKNNDITIPVKERKDIGKNLYIFITVGVATFVLIITFTTVIVHCKKRERRKRNRAVRQNQLESETNISTDDLSNHTYASVELSVPRYMELQETNLSNHCYMNHTDQNRTTFDDFSINNGLSTEDVHYERPFVPAHVSATARLPINNQENVTEDNILGRIARLDGSHLVSSPEQTQRQRIQDVKVNDYQNVRRIKRLS